MRKIILLIRRLLALSVLLGFTALFTGYGLKHFVFLAKLQFWPAVLASSAITLGVIIALTILAGRWYCSILCPLGILQDIAYRLKPHNAQQKMPAKIRRISRLAFLLAFLAVGFLGFGFSWFEPYGLFGRIVTTLFITLTAGIAIFTLAIWKGRVWCNWICPIGTILGLLSRFAPFRLKIDSSKCIGCRKCEKKCRASAISIQGKGGKIDSALCVQCRDCTVLCPKGAIGALLASPETREEARPAANENAEVIERRSFIIGTAAIGAALIAEGADEKIFDGGLADISAPGIDSRNASLKPAGSRSIKNFQTKCVGCQLCVKACPNHVLRPSKRLKDFMQPEMAFDEGYCTIDCAKCSHICPAGAIEAIPSSQKQNIHIGQALWHLDRCIAATEGVNCTACFRHCPVNAIERVEGPAGAMIPKIDVKKCIGCGACEHVCPSRPMPGITVKALEQHRQ